MTKEKYFQISTAIDYPSGRFHLGHAYEKIATDVLARWKRIQGYKVHFSTGTDCHGLKIQRNAKKANKDPKEFVNEISNQFKELAKKLNISNDDFIMTTESRHKKTAQYILNVLNKNNEIYSGDYEGLYCVDCETYYTEKNLENGCCPIHKTKVEKLKEETYFFKLSKYQKTLIKEISKGKLIWPKKKEKEILNRLKEPLKDLSISREQVNWGIPLPFDKSKTIFVWVEALINYLSTIDYPNKKYKDFWPATHFIGSDIIWHHTVIWYSILTALKLELPKVIVHGFVNVKGEKLSKSTGLRIDPIELIEKYGVDTLRYFLIRNISFGEDGDFSEDKLIERHNNELANKLGNLISRVSSLTNKYGLEKTKLVDSKGKKRLETIKKSIEDSKRVELSGGIEDSKIVSNKKVGRLSLRIHNKDINVLNIVKASEIKEGEKYLGNFKFLISSIVGKQIENYEFDKALDSIFTFIDICNEYIQNKKPWETKDKKVLYELADSIKAIAILLHSFIPKTSDKIAKQFHFEINYKNINKPLTIKKIKKSEILFKKINL